MHEVEIEPNLHAAGLGSAPEGVIICGPNRSKPMTDDPTDEFPITRLVQDRMRDGYRIMQGNQWFGIVTSESLVDRDPYVVYLLNAYIQAKP